MCTLQTFVGDREHSSVASESCRIFARDHSVHLRTQKRASAEKSGLREQWLARSKFRGGGRNVWLEAYNSILFGIPPLKAQKWLVPCYAYVRDVKRTDFLRDWWRSGFRGATSSSFRGGGIFVKFHSMTSSFSFNRGTTFSQTVTYNNNVFLPADTKSIVYKHTFCTTLVNKNRTFYNSVGGWITSVKRNFWLHAICACTEQHSTYKICWENWWFGLRVWCLGKCFGLGFMLQLEKEK